MLFQISDKRRSIDVESILALENLDQQDNPEPDESTETTSLLKTKSTDCVDHAGSELIENGYSPISQMDFFQNQTADDDPVNGHESPLSQSELDGLLNHPSLELSEQPIVHTSTPVGNKPALQPKPSLEKIKISKHVLLTRVTVEENTESVKDTVSPDKKKDPAEMSMKERLALFERNSTEAAAVVTRAPLTFSKRWAVADQRQDLTSRSTGYNKTSSDFEMVPLHSKSYLGGELKFRTIKHSR